MKCLGKFKLSATSVLRMGQNNSMKIAIVLASGMYPDIVGGAEIFTYDLAKALAKRWP